MCITIGINLLKKERLAFAIKQANGDASRCQRLQNIAAYECLQGRRPGYFLYAGPLSFLGSMVFI
jgi:hypothetical protein